MAEQVTSAKATAKTVRIAARKVRLVVDLSEVRVLLKQPQFWISHPAVLLR